MFRKREKKHWDYKDPSDDSWFRTLIGGADLACCWWPVLTMVGLVALGVWVLR